VRLVRRFSGERGVLLSGGGKLMDYMRLRERGRPCWWGLIGVELHVNNS
jgi:hypothetical protein